MSLIFIWDIKKYEFQDPYYYSWF